MMQHHTPATLQNQDARIAAIRHAYDIASLASRARHAEWVQARDHAAQIWQQLQAALDNANHAKRRNP